MKKFLYGVLGILIAILIYSGLLLKMPILAAPDMNKNIDEINNLSLNTSIDTSSIITMIGYQVFPHDIENRLSSGSFTYGRVNPMYFLRLKTEDINLETDNNKTTTSSGSSGRNIYVPRTRPGSSGRNIYISGGDRPTTGTIYDTSSSNSGRYIIPTLDKENEEKSSNSLASLENRYPKDVEGFLNDHNNRYIVYNDGKVLGYNKSKSTTEEVDLNRYLNRITKEGRLPLEPEYMYISSRFGVRVDPFTGGKGGLTDAETLRIFPFHTGLDLAAPGINGSNVYSVLGGVVEKVSHGNTGYGNHVIIDHGGFKTYYAHLSYIRKDLKTGTLIEAGERIGNVGSTGRSTGPHLHLEFNFGNVAISPELFISKDKFIMTPTWEENVLEPIPNTINLKPEEVKKNGN